MCCDLCMLDSRGKTKGGWFFILGFNMLKPNMSNTISIGTCSSDLYIHYFFETSGTASCGTTGTRYLYGYAVERNARMSKETVPRTTSALSGTLKACKSYWRRSNANRLRSRHNLSTVIRSRPATEHMDCLGGRCWVT